MVEEFVREAARYLEQAAGVRAEAVGVAPGRLEILGNHTDYNGGYIMSAAIDRRTAVAVSPRSDGTLRIFSQTLDDSCSASIFEPAPDPDKPWADYVKGVVVELRKAGVAMNGLDAAIISTIPLGSGLSSSAALEVATAMAVGAIHPFRMEPMQLAKLARRAENEFVGVGCGILDQFSAVFGSEDSFLFLDCLTLRHQTIRVDSDDLALVVCNSMTRHDLVEGEYNRRRSECFSAARKLGRAMGKDTRFLREISSADLEKFGDVLTDGERKRATHVILENERVLAGLRAAKRNDLPGLGRLVLESHRSSRDCFENSCPELDLLVESAETAPGCLGAKLSGGGFGGWTVNLVIRNRVSEFQKTIDQQFAARFKVHPEMLVCSIGEGARAVSLGTG